jgi:hypothetical protein
MTSISKLPLATDLRTMRKVTRDVDAAVRAAGQQLQADLAAKAEAKKQRDPIDVLEEKVMAATAVVAAATGTPEQAREMLAKARAKAMQAAADGADTGALEAMVRQMERLAKVAEEKRDAKSHGREHLSTHDDTGAAVIPALTAMTAQRF